MKILYFMDGIGNGGGIQEMVLNWISKFPKDIIVDILSYDTGKIDNYPARFEKYGGKIYIIPAFTRKGKFFTSLKETRKFFNNHCDYDVVHAHASSKAYFVLNEAKKHGIKIRILHSHCTQFINQSKISLLAGKILKPFAKNVSTNYFACSHEAGYFLFGKKFFDRKGNLIPNGIDLSSFNFDEKIRQRVRKELGIENKFVIGNIGRFRPQKNHKFLLNVMPEIIKKNPNSVLVICGTGELLEECKQIAKNLKIDGFVLFLGYRSDIKDIVQSFDVFVMTSIFEGLPVTAVETQAIGIPCVFSTNISRDTAINPNCIFLPLENAEVWAKTIIKTGEVKRINHKQNLINANFDIVDSSKLLIDLYKGFLKNVKK